MKKYELNILLMEKDNNSGERCSIKIPYPNKNAAKKEFQKLLMQVNNHEMVECNSQMLAIASSQIYMITINEK